MAVVGGGVSGLAAAHELLAASGGDDVRVTLYEQEDNLGGHARTVAVDDGGGGCVQVNVHVVVFGSFSGSQLPSSLWKERGRIEVAGALP